MFVGNGSIDLTPEYLHSFRPAWESNCFEFMKAGVGCYDPVDPGWVWRQDCISKTQEMSEELRSWSIGFQNGYDCGAKFDPLRCGHDYILLHQLTRFAS